MNSKAQSVTCGLGFFSILLAASTNAALDKISIFQSGPEAGHYLWWKGKPMLRIGGSVTQAWMECGTNFNQNAYVDAMAKRAINLLMLWAFKGTRAAFPTPLL